MRGSIISKKYSVTYTHICMTHQRFSVLTYMYMYIFSAEIFCPVHQGRDLVAWLVEHHLQIFISLFKSVLQLFLLEKKLLLHVSDLPFSCFNQLKMLIHVYMQCIMCMVLGVVDCSLFRIVISCTLKYCQCAARISSLLHSKLILHICQQS